jgi:hypothetical protein
MIAAIELPHIINEVYISWLIQRLSSDIVLPSISLVGQSHLIHPIQNTLEVVVVPPSLESLGMDTNTRRFFLTSQSEAHMA